MQLVEADQVDREARAWLKACERTPYLSSDWLNHLTSSYRDKAEQRAKERELAEAKLRHCEKQVSVLHFVAMYRYITCFALLNCLYIDVVGALFDQRDSGFHIPFPAVYLLAFRNANLHLFLVESYSVFTFLDFVI